MSRPGYDLTRTRCSVHVRDWNSNCAECAVKQQRILAVRLSGRKHRANNLEMERERERIVQRNRGFRKANPNKLKLAAGSKVRYAVYSGKLTKPGNCEKCGSSGTLHGHHTDYLQPLLVTWLCSSCHGIEHRKYATAPAPVAQACDAH